MGFAETAQLLCDMQASDQLPDGIVWCGEGSPAVRRWLTRTDDRGAPICVLVIHAITPLHLNELSVLLSVLERQRGRVALLIDGMDQAGCEYVVFKAAAERYQALGIHADIIIPTITSTGEGISSGPDRIDWYDGPTLEQWLYATASRESI